MVYKNVSLTGMFVESKLKTVEWCVTFNIFKRIFV